MVKQLFVTVASILVLVLGFPVIAFAGGDAFDVLAGRDRRTDTSWENLCADGNLEFSRSGKAKCARQDTDTDIEIEREREPRTASRPNIEAGLCVGASLNFTSTKVAARCVAQTEKPSQPAQPPNIAAGLCVGSTLNFTSTRVAKNCVRETSEDEVERTKPHSDQSKSHTHQGKAEVESNSTITPEPLPPAPSPTQYAALGDSVAAGVGLPGAVDGNSACGRTTSAYVYEVARSRSFTVNQLACSGATMGDLITKQSISGPNPEAQLDGAFAGGTPELITITAGANDIQWDEFLRKCFVSTCGTAHDQRVVNGLFTELAAEMQLAFSDIERRSSGSPPEVIMTGYYNPLSIRCTELEPRLTLDEVNWLTAQTNTLNQTLQNGANQSGFTRFVPIDFTGHDICSDNPWVQTLKDASPFHPTVEGQRAIAQMIN